MRLLLAIIIASASGCASVPYDQSSQEPDWEEVVWIRQQAVIDAYKATESICQRALDLQATVGRGTEAFLKAEAECLRVFEGWKVEKARYEQLGRILETLAPRSIDVDVYHH